MFQSSERLESVEEEPLVPLQLNCQWDKKKRCIEKCVEEELERMVAEDDSTRYDNSDIMSRLARSQKRRSLKNDAVKKKRKEEKAFGCE